MRTPLRYSSFFLATGAVITLVCVQNKTLATVAIVASVLLFGLIRCRNITKLFLGLVADTVYKSGSVSIFGYANSCYGMKLTMQLAMFAVDRQSECFKDLEMWVRHIYNNNLAQVYLPLSTWFPVLLDIGQFGLIQSSLQFVQSRPSLEDLVSFFSKKGVNRQLTTKKIWAVYSCFLILLVACVCYVSKMEFENVVEHTFDGVTPRNFIIYLPNIQDEGVIGASQGLIYNKNEYLGLKVVCRSKAYVKRNRCKGDKYCYQLVTENGGDLEREAKEISETSWEDFDRKCADESK